jgi:hypothetical protein
LSAAALRLFQFTKPPKPEDLSTGLDVGDTAGVALVSGV